jgi:hypothetical protein
MAAPLIAAAFVEQAECQSETGLSARMGMPSA